MKVLKLEFILRFREVVDEVKANAAKRRKGSNRLEQTGFTEEELYEQQQRLIQEAKKQQWEEEQSEYNKINFTTDHLQFQTAPVLFSCFNFSKFEFF